MAHWMVTATGFDREPRPADYLSRGSEGCWRSDDQRAASARLRELVPRPLFSIETGGAPGERDSVTVQLAAEAENAAGPERRVQAFLDDAYPFYEFTEFAAEPLTREHIARHWATRSGGS